MRNQTTVRGVKVQHSFEAAQQILADQTHFYLTPAKWDEFAAVLDAPPRNLPGLRELLSGPGVFDEPEESRSAR